MRNVIGRENLITCGWRKGLAQALWTKYSCDSFYMADRMGLDDTTLHYLVAQQAMVSVHTPIHSKITLTLVLAYLTNWPLYAPAQRMAFKALLNARQPFPRLYSSFLCAKCSAHICTNNWKSLIVVSGLEGTQKSARTCISESIIGMKIRPFVSYIKWLGEQGSVDCVFIACSLPFVRLIPQGHFFQNCMLHIFRGIWAFLF